MFMRVVLNRIAPLFLLFAVLHPPAVAQQDSPGQAMVPLYHQGGDSHGLAISGNLAFTCLGPDLLILDVTTDQPVLVGKVMLPTLAGKLAAANHYVCAADSLGGLYILDITDPRRPVILNRYALPESAHSLLAVGNRVYVADGASGVLILDLADPVRPTLLGRYDTAGSAEKVKLNGTMALVADGDMGLLLLNVSDPRNPVRLGGYDTTGTALDVVLVNNLAYVADGYGGILYIDISNPSRPALVGGNINHCDTIVAIVGNQFLIKNGSTLALLGDWLSNLPSSQADFVTSGTKLYMVSGIPALSINDLTKLSSYGLYTSGFYYVSIEPTVMTRADRWLYLLNDNAMWIYDGNNPAGLGWSVKPSVTGVRDMTIRRNLAYMARGSDGLQIADITNSANIITLGRYWLFLDAQAIDINGDLAYVADTLKGLHIFDVSRPTTPARLGGYDTPGNAKAVRVNGTLAYLVDGGSGLQIIDASDPNFPVLKGSLDTPGNAQDIKLAGNLAYIADGNVGGLQIIDVSNPANPMRIASVDTPGTAERVVVSDDLAYVADGASGLAVIDVRDPAHPASLGSFSIPGITVRNMTVYRNLVYALDAVNGLWILQPLAAHHLSRTGYAVDRAQVGRPVYGDRDDTLTGPIPTVLENQLLIRTLNGDKDTTHTDGWSFELSRPATVWVALDESIQPPPAWLAGWLKRPETLTVSGLSPSGRVLYTKEFAPGPVQLGPNRDGNMPLGRSMYSVLITPPVPNAVQHDWAIYP